MGGTTPGVSQIVLVAELSIAIFALKFSLMTQNGNVNAMLTKFRLVLICVLSGSKLKQQQ